MIFDIPTLAFISSLTFLTQLIALFIQYIVNRSYRGVVWWLIGSALWAIGVILMPLVSIKSVEVFARIANPLIIFGQVFLYIGMIRFVNKKENIRVLLAITVIPILFYYYFMFVKNDITSRTLVLMVPFTSIALMTASVLYKNKDRYISISANFTSLVFASFAGFSLFRIFWLIISPPMKTYSDQGTILQLTFILPIAAGLLWTFGFIIMVNQRLNGEIREEKEKLQLIFNTSPDAAIISRLADGSIIDVNAGFLRMTGYSRSEVINNTTIRINIWSNTLDRENFLKEIKANGFCENREFVFRRKDGSLFTGSISSNILTIQSVTHIVSVVHDITKNKQAEEALQESEELYRSILNASPDDITITDLLGCIQVVSPVAKKMFGYEPDYDDFIGSHLVEYIVLEDRERAKSNIIRMCKGEKVGPNEYRGVRQDGSMFDIEVNSGLILDANRLPSRMVFVVRDISERKQIDLKIQELVRQLEIEKKTAQLNAITDSLTGLANRRFFDEVINKEFHRAKRSGTPLSLIMLDVDRFKKFNDTYGHLAGDDCLRQIGITLKTLVGRVTDTVVRYGGEEFVVILTDTNQDGTVILAERIRKAVELLAIPHSGSDISEFVTVSLGVVTVQSSLLDSPEQAVALADAAMYRAKKAGRNRISVINEVEIQDLSKLE